MRGAILASAAASCVLCAIRVAPAAPILIFNTGVNAFGKTLADGTVGDPHYTLVAAPASLDPLTLRTKTSASGWPVGSWTADDALSTWIGPNTGDEIQGPPGPYDYRTTFSV